MPTFHTVFDPPPEVSGLTVTVDVSLSRVELDWDTSAIADVDFSNYRIYRSTDGANFEIVRQIGNKTLTHWEDYEAPLNTSITYRMTQSENGIESEPVEASAEIETPYWWVVVPNDTSLTFPISRVQSASLSSEKVQEVYTPIGRDSRLVVGDVVLTESGDISFLVYPDDLGKVALLKRIQARMEGGIIFKAPDGVTHIVQYGDMTRSLTNIPGLQEVSIPFLGAD